MVRIINENGELKDTYSPSNRQHIEQLNKWLIDEIGVQSPTARVFIIDVINSESVNITLKKITSSYIYNKRIAGTIHIQVQTKYQDKPRHIQASIFATRVLHYLVFGSLAIDNKKPIVASCPYTKDAKNFIITIAKSRKCLCLCYTSYVLAMAEEFGYEYDIIACNHEAHVNIAVLKYKGTQKKIRGKMQSHVEFGNRKINTWEASNGPETIPYCENFAIIDAGFTDNNYIIVETGAKKFASLVDIKDTELFDIDFTKKKDMMCQSDFDAHGGLNGGLVSHMYRIARRKNTSFDRWFCDISSIMVVYGFDDDLRKSFLGYFETLQKLSDLQHFDYFRTDNYSVFLKEHTAFERYAFASTKVLMYKLQQWARKKGMFFSPSELIMLTESPAMKVYKNSKESQEV
jgi:hypothetical protein